jgi:hypothetical protein
LKEGLTEKKSVSINNTDATEKGSFLLTISKVLGSSPNKSQKEKDTFDYK